MRTVRFGRNTRFCREMGYVAYTRFLVFFLLRFDSLLGPRSSVLGPQSSVLSPQSSVLNPQSSVLTPGSSVQASGDESEVARLKCLSLPHSGDWLNCSPIASLGLRIPATEFILMTKYRLGMQVFSLEGPCPACNRLSDQFGDHALNCNYSGERISRHNMLRDAIFEVAAAAALNPVKEGRFLLPGADRRPADVFIRGWQGGQDAALDVTLVTVTNPLKDDTRAGAAASPGHGASQAYERKMRTSADACRAQGITFLPLAAETFGGWHEVAVDQVRKLAGALARHNVQEEGEAISHTWSRLGVLLQRGNAAMMANRIPTFPAAPTGGRE